VLPTDRSTDGVADLAYAGDVRGSVRPVVQRVAPPRRVGLLAYLSCIRYREVLVLQGSPLLGAAFALGHITAETILKTLMFGLGSFFLVAHIFSFNDWAGTAEDSNDPNKSPSVFSTKGISPDGVLLLSAILLAAALLVFAVLPVRTLLLAVAIGALGIFYSHPSTNAKAIPVVSSCPHLLGGLLHFLLGYSLYRPIDRRGAFIGLFFGLTFTAGHLSQEVRDYDGDRLNGLRTNAVAFGRRRTFVASLAVFTLAYADLEYLAYSGLVGSILSLVPPVVWLIHASLVVSALRTPLDFENVSRYQERYRLLYGVIGLAMLATLLHR
jgi:4-hydroxybenzoate polyprenyltransferase